MSEQKYKVEGYAIQNHKVLSSEFEWAVTASDFLERVIYALQNEGKLLIEKIGPLGPNLNILQYGPGSDKPVPYRPTPMPGPAPKQPEPEKAEDEEDIGPDGGWAT